MILPISRMKKPPSPQDENVESNVNNNPLTGTFVTRFSQNIYPHRPSNRFNFPLKDRQSYENELVGVEHNRWSFNFLMSDGTRSNLPTGDQAMQLARIPQDAVIQRVTIFYDPRDHITGLHFFDQNNTNILTAGACDYTPVDINL